MFFIESEKKNNSNGILCDESLMLMTVDVEDWFQVENLKKSISFSAWPSFKLRVEENTFRLLDLLDSYKQSYKMENGRTERVYAPTTFFVLGWVAERLPHLVREIHRRGHEVASHGYLHNLCQQQSFDYLIRDLNDSKKLLEDIIGSTVYGYRAPSFSITGDILKIIEDCGYLYDSSFNSFGMNGRYGHIDVSQYFNKGYAIEISKNFYEIPIGNIKFGKCILPWGGGGYFRLIPFSIFKNGVKRILSREGVYLFYIHSWEIDPQQPRVKEASVLSKFRHYFNLEKTDEKMKKFISHFQRCRFQTCRQYLEKITQNEHSD